MSVPPVILVCTAHYFERSRGLVELESILLETLPMSRQCKLCGGKLFGGSIALGVCEYCALDRQVVRGLIAREPEDDDDFTKDDVPSLYERRRGGPEWARFKSGLSFHLTCLFFLTPISLGLVGAVSSHAVGRDLGGFLVLGCVLVFFFWLIGSAQLCSVPNQAGLKVFAWGNFVCPLVGVFFFFIFTCMNAWSHSGSGSAVGRSA